MKWKIDAGAAPGMRRAFIVTDENGHGDGIPPFRTLRAAQKAISQLESGTFTRQFATMRAAREWVQENSQGRAVYNENTGFAEVI
jgi:hypothetical protein